MAEEKENEVADNEKKNIDFYVEDGNLVFTETYLKKRGYCCESGCRHCPYGFKKKE